MTTQLDIIGWDKQVDKLKTTKSSEVALNSAEIILFISIVFLFFYQKLYKMRIKGFKR